MIFTFLQFLLAWTSIHFLITLLKRIRLIKQRRLPPGPIPLPIVGNLLSLGEKPHKSLAVLSKTYGPVMCLQLGSLTTVVVSSVDAAREVLKKNDAAFASRQVQDALTTNGHHEVSVVFLPAGRRWRNLRKICNTYVLSTSRLDASKTLRKKKVQQLLTYVQECSETRTPVNIGLAAFSTSLNLLSNTFFSTDLAGTSSDDATSRDLKELVWEIEKEVGKPNIADFFPVLKPLDPQGVRPRIRKLIDRLCEVFDRMIEPRLAHKKANGCFEDNDVLDALLCLSQGKEADPDFTLKDIKHLLSDLFTAGTDTTSSTIEWAMAELLHNPEKLNKAKSEIRDIIGKQTNFEEEDIMRLPYLQAVVKETLRLHPPTPLLIPRKVETDVDLCDFTVPGGSQLFVNVWAMGRDARVWENPYLFEPERFLLGNLMMTNKDYKGHDFEFIPFGAGRRICPGLMLAHRMLHLVIGSLLNSFDWKLPGGMSPELMDMEDKFGLTLQKAQSLCAVPVSL